MCPFNCGSNYFNFKHFFSTVLAYCNPYYRFIWAEIVVFENAAAIFRRSQISKDVENTSVKLEPENFQAVQTFPYLFIVTESFLSNYNHILVNIYLREKACLIIDCQEHDEQLKIRLVFQQVDEESTQNFADKNSRVNSLKRSLLLRFIM